MDTPWRIELLGWLRAKQGDQVVARFRTQKTGALLAYLAYYRHRSHPRDALIELLWPEDGLEVGRNKLRQALTSLRHQLEPPGVPAGAVIRADRSTVQLNPAAVTTDVAQYEAALQAASRTASGKERAQRLTEAAELYRGELVPGYVEGWILTERERLAEVFHQTLAQLIGHQEQAGDLAAALQWARRAVSADPLREEAHRDLIRLLAAGGQPQAALRQYEALQRCLEQELGTEPESETRALASSLRSRCSVVRSSAFQRASMPARCSARTETDASPPGRLSVPPPASTEQRAPSTALPTGTVTFLLTDIEGSTALWQPGTHPSEATGYPERSEGSRCGDAFKVALASHHALLRQAFGEHSGYEVKELGDGFLVAFAAAGDALTGAVAGQRALAVHPWPDAVRMLRVRMALYTGDVEREKGDYRGLVLHRASRLLLAAHGGQILCSEETAALLHRDLEPDVRLADLGLYRLRGEATPEHLFQVEYPAMAQRVFPPPNAEAGYAGNLPLQFTHFFGREAETAQLCGAYSPGEPRLVTLSGPGGTGKTRLALEVAARLREGFQGAVWFVPLVDLADARRIPDRVRDALRLPRSPHLEPLEQVVAMLSRQPSLLVLDNYEHLVAEGASVVRRLIEQVSTLAVLVTSRQRLELPGEREFPVSPLPTPVVGSSLQEPAGLIQCPSVQLFVDRAQAARPDFQVTAGNTAAVAALCERLEGIPLALELAAARAWVLTPAQMLDRLSQRFELLVSRQRGTDVRHRSLRAALDWSYQLLSPELQRFFARLSVFRGGWTLLAAEAVCGFAEAPCSVLRAPREEPSQHGGRSTEHGAEVLDYLEQLRECSLVLTAESGTEIRYRILETLREYGREQMASEELGALERRHAGYYLALAEEAEPELDGPEQVAWLERLEREHDNLRAALAWCQGRGAREGKGLRLASALLWFWRERGHFREGHHWLEKGLAQTQSLGRTPARARALAAAGHLGTLHGVPSAAAHLHESLAIFRELEDKRGLAEVLPMLGWRYLHQGKLDAARAAAEEGVVLSQELGHRRLLCRLFTLLGDVALASEDSATARSLLEKSLVLSREEGFPSQIAWALYNLGRAADAQNDPASACARYEESLALFREVGTRSGIVAALKRLGKLAHERGDDRRAFALYEESLQLAQELGDQESLLACLEGLAEVAAAQGQSGVPTQWVAAVRLLGAAEAVREAIHPSMLPPSRPIDARAMAAARAALGEAAFAAAWAEGRALPPEQAIAEVGAAADGDRAAREGRRDHPGARRP